MEPNQSVLFQQPGLMDGSRSIITHAMQVYQPKAIVMMFSGGDDSLTAYHVSKELGISFDYVVFGDTRTGIEDTRSFVISEVERNGDRLLIADAGDAYVNYVMRKGFFGSGESAHTYSYHVLKSAHFRRVVSQSLRSRRKNFPILFVNGARRNESGNRKITMKSPYRLDPALNRNVWVNIINEWEKHDCIDYLEGNGIKRNTVSVNLCRSGECMCGTMQSSGDRNEASYFYPHWGRWLADLEREVLKKFPWKWGEGINKYHHMEMNGQLNAFQPMCTGCKINFV